MKGRVQAENKRKKKEKRERTLILTNALQLKRRNLMSSEIDLYLCNPIHESLLNL